MKADYYRHISERTKGEMNKKLVDAALKVYDEVLELEKKFRKTYDPIRLG